MDNLRSKPELNGLSVTALSFDTGSGRYKVKLPSGRILAVKPENLNLERDFPQAGKSMSRESEASEATVGSGFLPRTFPLEHSTGIERFLPQTIPLDYSAESRSFLPQIILPSRSQEPPTQSDRNAKESEAQQTIKLVINIAGKDTEVVMLAKSTVAELKDALFEGRHTDLLTQAQKIVRKGAVVSDDQIMSALVDTGTGAKERGHGSSPKLMLLPDTSYAPSEVKFRIYLPNRKLQPVEVDAPTAGTTAQLKALLQRRNHFPPRSSYVLYDRQRCMVLTDDTKLRGCMSPEYLSKMASRDWRRCTMQIMLQVVPRLSLLISAACTATTEELNSRANARLPNVQPGSSNTVPTDRSSAVPTQIRTGLAHEFGSSPGRHPRSEETFGMPVLPIAWGMGLEYERHPLLCSAVANTEFEEREIRVVEEEMMREGAGWAAEMEPALEIVQTRMLQRISRLLDEQAEAQEAGVGAGAGGGAGGAGGARGARGAGEGSGAGVGAVPAIAPQVDQCPLPDNVAYSWVMALQQEEQQQRHAGGAGGQREAQSAATAEYLRLARADRAEKGVARAERRKSAAARGVEWAAEREERAKMLHQRVHIHSLKSRPDLNGSIGVVGSFNHSKGRYAVEIDSGHVLALRPGNLTLVSAGSSVGGAGSSVGGGSSSAGGGSGSAGGGSSSVSSSTGTGSGSCSVDGNTGSVNPTRHDTDAEKECTRVAAAQAAVLDAAIAGFAAAAAAAGLAAAAAASAKKATKATKAKRKKKRPKFKDLMASLTTGSASTSERPTQAEPHLLSPRSMGRDSNRI
jgi:hypothetical protein